MSQKFKSKRSTVYNLIKITILIFLQHFLKLLLLIIIITIFIIDLFYFLIFIERNN